MKCLDEEIHVQYFMIAILFSRANMFMQKLEGLYEAQNMDLGDITADRPKKLNILRMRAILDSVVEQLPPLLELGDVPSNVIPQQYDFPYHRPSVVSVSTVESIVMPESLGFVLLQVNIAVSHTNLNTVLSLVVAWGRNQFLRGSRNEKYQNVKFKFIS